MPSCAAADTSSSLKFAFASANSGRSSNAATIGLSASLRPSWPRALTWSAKATAITPSLSPEIVSGEGVERSADLHQRMRHKRRQQTDRRGVGFSDAKRNERRRWADQADGRAQRRTTELSHDRQDGVVAAGIAKRGHAAMVMPRNEAQRDTGVDARGAI